MIKKLRTRFIIITMISVVIVLSVIMTTINVMNYLNAKNDADRLLLEISENGGEFGNSPKPPMGPFDGKFNEETPFETRFFSVIFYNDGSTEIDVSHIAAINSNRALEYASDVLDKTKGYKDNYRYMTTVSEDKTLVVFIDCTKVLSTANSFLLYSVIISLIGILGIFLLVFFLSKKVVNPMVKSYEKQKMFITNASHELKTPLTIISANNEMLEIEGKENECTKAIAKQIDKMNSMVKNLVMLSRLEENKFCLNDEVCLNDIVNDVVSMFDASFSFKNISVKVSCYDDVNIKCNESLIRQLFYIIFDNALKYCKTYIDFSLEKSNRYIIIIKNDCDNISPGNLNHFFERFYRSDVSRASDIEGSGIGLSIAKEIINLHKGDISAYSTKDNEFTLKIIFNTTF